MNHFEFRENHPAPNSTTPQYALNDDEPVDFSSIQLDVDLQFISRILLEEDKEDKFYLFQGDPALVAAVEKSFFDILYNKDPPISPDGPPLYAESLGSSGDIGDGGQIGDWSSGTDGKQAAVDIWDEQSCSWKDSTFFDPKQEIDELLGLPFQLEDAQQPIWQFNKGVEEAGRFLPERSKLVIDVTGSGASAPPVVGNVGETRGVKNQHDQGFNLEVGRRVKVLATYAEEHVPMEMYEALLCNSISPCNPDSSSTWSSTQNGGEQSPVPNGVKPKGRKQSKREVVDWRSLLILCAQSISIDDRLSANQQLKQIRQLASIRGDGWQRLAHYFADGLEARLAGTGSEIYRSHIANKASAADILKAFLVFMTACPFKKMSYAFANQTISRIAKDATRIHIIDFGIGFGFHWPCLIQSLSSRSSGPARLRITGIDLPQPGFRPSMRVEETGRRLAEFAQELNLPFEYHPIASKWELVKIEDLAIREDELLVVTCTHMLMNLADETVSVDCPRNIVLNNIRKMNPSIFIHGIVNGAYSSPFFLTRFREALFHFSALFDAFDCNVSREDPHRLMLEREFLGREVLNVIACEGVERVHRPETYKQWQVRNQRCGFSQLPLDPVSLRFCKEKIMSLYNKDFLVDTDGKWLVQGWKGRVLYAVSTWKPNSSKS